MSFIDNNCKAVFKGSELGKAFSWNNLAKRFEPATTYNNKAKIHTKSDLPGQLIVTRETMKAVSSAVATVYHQLRKDPLQGDYFESAFIRKLDKIDLITPLLNYPVPLSVQQVTGVAERFKAFKKAKLPQIEKKEKAYFNKQVDIGLKFIEKMQQSELNGKLSFLFRYNLSVTKKGDQLFLTHTKGKHLSLPLEADKRRLVMGEGNIIPLIDTSKLIPFTKKEKDLIALIASGKENVGNKKCQQIIKVEPVQMAKVNHTATTLFDAADSHNYGEGVDSHHGLNKKKKRRQRIS
ncbi:hypothetical protein GXP67_30960 [Rhodocytophaga rosea]|uniref:Uncharacterized protein n=1 Tax=Rhodocytophaga rosea TaxID=2704465 RepID=A0A6C0GRM4_9BACT|nr:hypothetical protein [Rhodocytophaga rosea]QHT70755.1 hypothetical protein GXP67_30960 [Rhodocytophaga rosea]